MEDTNSNYGLCECGCGQKTVISKYNDKRHGYIKGEPRRFIRGHAARKGGKSNMGKGYVGVLMPDHPRANSYGYVMEHIVVVEEILGKFLPPGAVVHHVDGDRTNNTPSNLVLCQDDTYHKLIHRRIRRMKRRQARRKRDA